MPSYELVKILRQISLPVSLTLLAACGSGGGGGNTGTPGIPGTNGLNFGAVGQTVDDVEGVTMDLTGGGYSTVGGNSASVSSGQTVRVDSGIASGMLNGIVEVGGENVTITNGSGVTTGGETVLLVYEDTRSGTYSGALDVVVFDSGVIVAEQGIVFGFETNPAAIADRTFGSLTYTGGFQASGDLDGTLAEYEGSMTLTADFTGAGSVSGSLDGTLGGGSDVDITIGSTSISGNGFSGSTTCAGMTCVGGGNIDGTFYGPDAEEVGGVLTFDFDAGGDDYIGAGTFVLTDPVP